MTQLKQFMVVVTGYDLTPQVKKTRLKLLILVIIFLAIFLILHSVTVNSIVNNQIYMKVESVSTEYDMLSKIVETEEKKLLSFFYTYTLLLWMLMSFCSWILLNIILRPVSNTEKEREQFIHNARHELRTPLTVLQSELELFDTTKLNPETKMDLFGIKQQVTRLIELSQNLLTNLTYNESLIKNDVINISKIVNKIDNQIKTIYISKNISLKSNIPDVELSTNLSIFNQLLTNVIENIYKHGDTNSEYTIEYFDIKKTLVFINKIDKSKKFNNNGIGIIASKALANKLNYTLNSDTKKGEDFETSIHF